MGRRPGTYVVGDLQGVSSLEADDDDLRLFQLLYEDRFLRERLSLLAGLYALDSEFDAIESAGLFIHGSQGTGVDFARSGPSGPSVFPHSAMAVRAHHRFPRHGSLRLAVLDDSPALEDPGASG